MGQLKWYKRDPDAALSGMMGLSLEERGAYNTVLDLLYTRDGALPDDHRFIAGWLGTDVRVWRRIRASLIAQGKLAVVDGLITNSRATLEIDSALSRLQSAREAGHASARSRRHKSNRQTIDSNDLAETNAPTKMQRTVRLATATATATATDSDASASLGAHEFVVPAEALVQFRQHRTAIRKPMTSRAEQLIVMTLERIHRDYGHDPTAVLNQSIVHGWAGVFPLREERHGKERRKGSHERDRRTGLQRVLDRRLENEGPGPPADQDPPTPTKTARSSQTHWQDSADG